MEEAVSAFLFGALLFSGSHFCRYSREELTEIEEYSIDTSTSLYDTRHKLKTFNLKLASSNQFENIVEQELKSLKSDVANICSATQKAENEVANIRDEVKDFKRKVEEYLTRTSR